MMPPPDELAAIIDRAERIAEKYDGALMRCAPLRRRHSLAEAVMRRLRDDREDAWRLEPVPV